MANHQIGSLFATTLILMIQWGIHGVLSFPTGFVAAPVSTFPQQQTSQSPKLMEIDAIMRSFTSFNTSEASNMPVEYQKMLRHFQKNYDFHEFIEVVTEEIEEGLEDPELLKRNEGKLKLFINEQIITNPLINRAMKELAALENANYAAYNNSYDKLLPQTTLKDFHLSSNEINDTELLNVDSFSLLVISGILFKEIAKRVNEIDEFVIKMKRAYPKSKIRMEYSQSEDFRIVKEVFSMKWHVRRNKYLEKDPQGFPKFYEENPPLFPFPEKFIPNTGKIEDVEEELENEYDLSLAQVEEEIDMIDTKYSALRNDSYSDFQNDSENNNMTEPSEPSTKSRDKYSEVFPRGAIICTLLAIAGWFLYFICQLVKRSNKTVTNENESAISSATEISIKEEEL